MVVDMTYLSFNVIKATFDGDNDVTHFECIGWPDGKACGKELGWSRKNEARALLRTVEERPIGEKGEDGEYGKNRRDIIVLLLCKDCQGTYKERNNIMSRWQEDSPGIGFGPKGSPSHFSLHPSRSTSQRRRSSNATPSSTAPRPSARTTTSDSDVVREPPSSPSEDAANRRRRSAPGRSPCLEPSGVEPPSTRHQEPNNAHGGVQNDPVMAYRGRSRTGCADVGRLDRLIEESTPESAQPDDNGSNPGSSAREIVSGSPPPTPPDSAEEETISISDTHPFSHGEASTWQPCALRSRVFSIFWKPLLEERGSIYAVKVKDRPYVKIGKTRQDTNTRLRSIRSEHRQVLDTGVKFNISDIPLLQLTRLEDLVKADLAFFQRDLHTGPKNHVEYFEVGLDDAKRTIVFWKEKLESQGVESGKVVDSKVSTAIQASALSADMFDGEEVLMTETERKRINSDHDLRICNWEKSFSQGQAGFKWHHHHHHSQVPDVRAIIGCAVLLLLPDIFSPSYRLFYGVLCLWAVVLAQGCPLSRIFS